MSYCECDYEMPSVFSTTTRIARKAHRCSECYCVSIQPGEQYEYVWGVWNGEPSGYKTCPRCISLREYLRAHVPCFCWSFGDLRSSAIKTAHEYQNEAPGLLFGILRREVEIQQIRKYRAIQIN